MTSSHRISQALLVAAGFVRRPSQSLRLLRFLPVTLQGLDFGENMRNSHRDDPGSSANALSAPNPLQVYFDAHRLGPGIWKWDHYFDIYHRHFAKFVGREAHVLEVGVFSGGTLGMWREYFGPKIHVYGVDINPECKKFEDENTRIFIGDQSDRAFWASIRRQVPDLDILIDDGGHIYEQQIITLEEVLPHLRAGGVYVCEDVHSMWNPFSAYIEGLVLHLNAYSATSRTDVCQATPFQNAVQSIHTYPFVTVIERSENTCTEFTSVRHGSEWLPSK